MPIYEYQCQHCHHCFEEIQKMSDAPITLCPHCHQSNVQRLVSAAGFQLKGTGWYVTDFKDKGKPKATTTADKASEPSAESSKPATEPSQSATSTIKASSSSEK